MRVIILAILFINHHSWAATSAIHEYHLDNGLTILVKEDHRAPVATSMVWYNAGSADEQSGKTGLAHALEHMMFKGTPKYPVGVFSQMVAALGGQENAFTNTDYTAYFENIAKDKLATCFELEADRMSQLLLDDKEFSKEIRVIQEERHLRTDDNPQAIAFERFMAAAHLTMPYHHPVIGWMSDLKTMTAADTRDWYNHYYAPNNATLVVVGDVNPDEVFSLAKKTFGPITKHATIERKPQIEPPALGQKSVTIHHHAKLPMIMMGYTVPSLTSSNKKDAYSLELLAAILDAGENGRLPKNLIRGTHVATSANVYYNLYSRYQTQFILFGIPGKSHFLKDLQTQLQKEIDTLKTTPVDMMELARVKTQLIAQKTFEKDSVFGQAMALGLLQTIGLSYKDEEAYVDNIKEITPKDLQETANRYFKNEALTIAKLIPDNDKQG